MQKSSKIFRRCCISEDQSGSVDPGKFILYVWLTIVIIGGVLLLRPVIWPIYDAIVIGFFVAFGVPAIVPQLAPVVAVIIFFIMASLPDHCVYCQKYGCQCSPEELEERRLAYRESEIRKLELRMQGRCTRC